MLFTADNFLCPNAMIPWGGGRDWGRNTSKPHRITYINTAQNNIRKPHVNELTGLTWVYWIAATFGPHQSFNTICGEYYALCNWSLSIDSIDSWMSSRETCFHLFSSKWRAVLKMFARLFGLFRIRQVKASKNFEQELFTKTKNGNKLRQKSCSWRHENS